MSLDEQPHFFRIWWGTLIRPDSAGTLVLEDSSQRGFTTWLLGAIFVLYAVFGASMGLFGGGLPAFVSAIKLPFLYLGTALLCLPPLYVLNCLAGPGFTLRECLRLLFFLVSANAAALASYAPISYFFALTTSDDGYAFLVLMNTAVFAMAGAASIVVNVLILRSSARALGVELNRLVFFAWALLYGFVGTQAAWALRPWFSAPYLTYQPIRPVSGTFIQGVWDLIQRVM